MEEVFPRLFVGGDIDYDKLKDRAGWSWLRCCKYGPGGHQQTLGYTSLRAPRGKDYLDVRRGNLLALNLLDLDDPNYIPDAAVNKGLKFVSERLDAGDKVLVACNEGHSRGPTMAMMYLRSIGELPYPFLISERLYKALYSHYDPAQGMRQYARANWARLAPEGNT